jgi:hypothetical protein
VRHTNETWTKEYDFKSNFKYCLDKGKEGEEYTRKILSGDFKIETKVDFLCKDTGTVFIEYKSRGKDSGIKVTTADFWNFVLPENNDTYPLIIFIHINKLKKLVEDKKYKTVVGGDNKTSVGYLIPKEDIIKLNK